MNRSKLLIKIDRDHGFTVIELMVVVLIFSLLVGMAIPVFPAMMQSSAKGSAKDIFEADLAQARAMAISENARVIFTFSDGGNVYTFGPDFYPYNDPVGADQTTNRRNLPTGITISSSATVMFSSRGFLITTGEVPTTSNILFAYQGSTYSTGTLYPAGRMFY